MTAQERLLRLQNVMVARGMQDFKVTLNPSATSLDAVTEDVADALEAYVEDRVSPLIIGDSVR